VQRERRKDLIYQIRQKQKAIISQEMQKLIKTGAARED
jgi:hypothetical protein